MCEGKLICMHKRRQLLHNKFLVIAFVSIDACSMLKSITFALPDVDCVISKRLLNDNNSQHDIDIMILLIYIQTMKYK